MPAEAASPGRMTHLLGHHDFRLLLASETINEAGSQVSAVALPLVAVIVLHASPGQMGILLAAQGVASALFGLQVGVWIDRLPYRPVLITSHLVRAFLLLTVPVAAAFHLLTMIQMYVVGFFLGLARLFFDVGYQSYLPSLTGRANVVQGNSRLETVRATVQFTGPGMGGLIVSAVGAPSAVLVDALSYVGSVVMLLRIRHGEPKAQVKKYRNFWRDVKEGLVFVLGHPILRMFAASSAITNLFFGSSGTVQMIYLIRDVGLSARDVGLLLSVCALGGILGAAAASRLARIIGSARLVWVSIILTTPFWFFTPLTGAGWRVILFPIGASMTVFGQILYSVAQLSFRQAICPDALLGRMNATMRFLVLGLYPLGALLGGALGDRFGVHATLWVIAVGLACAPLPVLLSPVIHMRDLTH